MARLLAPLLVSLLCAADVTASPGAPGPDTQHAPAAPDDRSALSAADAQLSRFGAGGGPRLQDGVLHLLDEDRTPAQSNAIAFGAASHDAHETLTLRGRIHVTRGGDGGALMLLNTREYGARGPAPFLPDWTAPDLRGSLAVGIDVHDPPTDEPFGPWGNVQGLPQREVSLHWDGRELVKRVAPQEFRGEWVELELRIEHVCGGAEVSLTLGDSVVYERHFVPGLLPYPARLAVGAGTRDDASMGFDVADLSLTTGPPAAPRRPSLQVEVFNHVLTDNSQTSFEAELQLPPPSWAFGRVLLTLDIHDAGSDWDEWDRTGEIFIQDADGAWRGLVPFITSYRTECHWVVDVTHFRPLLSGTTRLKIAAGTSFYKDRGFMLSVSLAFHHALPDDLRSPAPARVTPLWHGTAHYRSAQNHFSDFFTPQAVTLGEQTEAARVFLTTTGHSQVGEFTPSLRTLVFAPVQGGEAEQRYENTLWKTDCYLNPNRPQFGTWKYPRAGWAPGDVVAPWWIDLTPHITPGAVAELRYEPSPYDFEGADEVPDAGAINAANQFVRAWLIEYATPTDAVAAPTLLVTNVVADSAAARAGLRAGDFLASYDGARVDSVAELGAAKTAASEAGKARVPVVVFRGEQRLELELDSGRMGVNLSGG